MTNPDHDDWSDADTAGAEGDGGGGTFVLQLDGYEGPIDVLLELARSQKVDLAEISILQLVDQFLGFVREAKRLNLSLAADYLVMAAWLAYLKSRLLVPKNVEEGEDDPEDLAALLTFRLQQLSAMRQAADDLLEMPRLGLQRFATKRVTAVEIRKKVNMQASLFDLLKAYAAIQARREGRRRAVPKVEVPFTMEAAVKRLARVLPGLENLSWTSLKSFLPPDLATPFERRSATASYFGAVLELAKQGIVTLSQSGAHEDLMLKAQDLDRLDRVSAADAAGEDTDVWDLKGEIDQAEDQARD